MEIIVIIGFAVIILQLAGLRKSVNNVYFNLAIFHNTLRGFSTTYFNVTLKDKKDMKLYNKINEAFKKESEQYISKIK